MLKNFSIYIIYYFGLFAFLKMK